MILGIEIAMIIIGLLALVRGRMTLTRNKVVVGVPARLLGALALTPLPVALVAVVGYIAMNAPADPERFAADNQVTIIIIETAIVIGIAVLVFGIGAAVAVDPVEAERRQRRDYDAGDDYEDGGRDRDDRDRREWER
jgi:hypothetical protein